MTNTAPTTSPDTCTTESTVIDTYLESWNETDVTKRATLIDAALGADIWYRCTPRWSTGRAATECTRHGRPASTLRSMT